MSEVKEYYSDDEQFILDVVGTFRFGAPITLDDIRFAAKADGRNIDYINGSTLSRIVSKRCSTIKCPGDFEHDYHKYVREW